MSQIPFVNQLGDAIQTAATASSERSSRFRLRRPGVVATLAALLALSGGVALAGILSASNTTDLATGGVGCYETADRSGAVFIIEPGDRSPAEACRQVLGRSGQPVAELAACDNGRGAIAVFPGSGANACHRAGLKPLPPEYEAEQERVRHLTRALVALESSANCIPPRELAARVQTLLQRTGWENWRPWLRLDINPGPCGSVSEPGFDGSRVIVGLDPDGRRVMVFGGPERVTGP
jgi:hypothetical protein